MKHPVIVLRVGADCEVFLKNPRGWPVPVIGKLGGTKLDPKPIPEFGPGYAVQEDNVMAEFNIPAAGEVTSFVTSINKVLGWLHLYFKNCGATDILDGPYFINISSSEVFTQQQLDHPQAQEIGCEPDANAWTDKLNSSPKENAIMKYLRTAAAHIHTSYVSVDPETGEQTYPTREAGLGFAQMQDLTLGVGSILLDQEGKRRRAVYGKSGAFRFKDYGFGFAGHEYRVLSNFWLATDALKAWVFNQTLLAGKLLSLGEIDFTKNGLGEFVQNTINTGNEEAAMSLCSEFGIKLPS